MEVFHPLQIGTLVLQCFLVTVILTSLFWMRRWLGFNLLYAAIGIMQYMQVYFSHTLYIEIMSGVRVAPSSMFFVGTLFAVLLMYIREDAESARKIIYAVIITNVLLLAFQFVVWLSINVAPDFFSSEIIPQLFVMNTRMALVGTTILFFDVIWTIVLYEWFSKFTYALFLRIISSMLVVVLIDSILFSVGVFTSSENLLGIIQASTISKSFMVLVYSIFFTAYLAIVEKRMTLPGKAGSFQDFFHYLTYRQKFEQLDSRSKLVVETMTDGLLIISERAVILEVNEAYCKMSGYNEEELIGRQFFELEADHSYEEIEKNRDIIHEKKNLRFEAVHRAKNGDFIQLDINAFLIQENGEKLIVSFCRDITEAKAREVDLKKNAERWEKAEKIAGFGSFSFDLSNGNLEASKEFYALSGLRPELRVLDRDAIISLVHAEDLGSFATFSKQLKDEDSAGEIKKLTYRVMLSDTESRWRELNAEPFFDSANLGRPSRVWGAILDIHDQKIAEDNLKLSLKMQRLAAEISRDFVMAESENIDAVIGLALEKMGAVLDVDHISLTKMEGKIVSVSHEWNRNKHEVFGNKFQAYDTSELRSLWSKFEALQPLLIHGSEENNSEPLSGLLKKHQVKSLLIIPLISDQKIIGSLSFVNLHSVAKWEESTLEILKFLSSAFSSFIHRHHQSLALWESEGRFRAIFEQAAVGVVLVNVKTARFIRANSRTCEIFGYAESELTRLSYLDITHPDDLEASKRFTQGLLQSDNSLDSLAKRYVKKNGETVWAHLSSSQLSIGNEKTEYFIGIIEDITESKLLNDWKALNADVLEKATRMMDLSTVIAEITGGIDALIPGANSSVSLVNEENLLIPYGETKIPKAWIEFITPNKIGPEMASCGASVYHKERVVVDDIANDFRWTYLKEEAQKHDFHSCWSEPIISADTGEVLGAFCLYFKERKQPNDTEIKIMSSVGNILSLIIKKLKAETELSRHRDNLENLVKVRTADLEKANDELRSFSYSVSHDLRAPLTRINGFSKILEKNYLPKLDEKGAHYLRRIRASSQYMASLIDDILALTKVSRKEINVTRVSLSALAKDILHQLREEHPNRKTKIYVEEDIFVDMDIGLAQLMMTNLLNNAWKYSGKKEIGAITFGQCLRNEQNWFFIQDNGIGFDMEYYDQLFRPFQRLHSQEEIKGTGIGLATVQRIIEKHGGRIEAESIEGVGATFYFTV